MSMGKAIRGGSNKPEAEPAFTEFIVKEGK